MRVVSAIVALVLLAVLLAGLGWWVSAYLESPGMDPDAAQPLTPGTQDVPRAVPLPTLAERAPEDSTRVAPEAGPEDESEPPVDPPTALDERGASTDGLPILVQLQGSPVSGAAVSLWESPAQSHEDPPHHRGTTDSHGRCLIRTGATRGTVYVWSETDRASAIARWSSREELVVDLSPMARVRGRVLWPDERPAADATVVFDAKASFMSTASIDRVQEVDSRGRFEIDLDARTVQEVVARVGASESPPMKLFVEAGESKEVTLYLPGAFRIEGIVLDPHGAPLPDIEVRIWHLPSDDSTTNEMFSSPAQQHRVKTGGLGEFSCDMSGPGRFEVLARSASNTTRYAEVTLEATKPSTFIELTLPATRAIAGRVVWTDGTPASATQVRAEPDLPENPMAALSQAASLRDRFPNRSTQTEPDGSFRIEGLHPDVTYRLSCQPDGDDPATHYLRHVLPGTLGLEIVLDEESLRGAVLTGRIRARDGSPIPRATVECFRITPTPFPIYSHGMVGEPHIVDDPGGMFEIEHLVPGDVYGVKVVADGFAIAGRDGIEMDLPGREVEVVVGGPGSLEVRVRAPGRRLEDVTVIVLPMPFFLGASEELAVDPAGFAHTEACPPGEVFLVIRNSDKTIVRSQAVVTSGQTTVVTMDVPRVR